MLDWKLVNNERHQKRKRQEKISVWMLQHANVVRLKEDDRNKRSQATSEAVEGKWKNMKEDLLVVAVMVCDKSRRGSTKKEKQ